jgi:hypothetical protein
MKLLIILIVLSLMAFISVWVWAGGYLYFSPVKNTAFEKADGQSVFHAEMIRNHLIVKKVSESACRFRN